MPAALLGSLADYADASRCAGDALCLKVHAVEPTLPISPPFAKGLSNPCIETKDGLSCLPAVHLISGWHQFDQTALTWLSHVKQIKLKNSGCFDDWSDDSGGGRWAAAGGGAPAADVLITTECRKLLTWYPAFAGRYTVAWGKEYGPCKEREVANAQKEGVDYYDKKMWPICRPAAMRAHDASAGTGGPGHEVTPPFVMRQLYGNRAKAIAAVRNPVDRLETSFWAHQHYPRRYGESADGLHKYIDEQTRAFSDCADAHGGRRCAYLYELLDRRYSDVFFHCDQIIRGLYEPFVQDWSAALGKQGLLILRVEDLMDRAAPARRRLLEFLGVPVVATLLEDSSEPPGKIRASYKRLHAQSLKHAHPKVVPMAQKTRQLTEQFYAPYNQKLAKLLDDAALTWPEGSAVVGADEIARSESAEVE